MIRDVVWPSSQNLMSGVQRHHLTASRGIPKGRIAGVDGSIGGPPLDQSLVDDVTPAGIRIGTATVDPAGEEIIGPEIVALSCGFGWDVVRL